MRIIICEGITEIALVYSLSEEISNSFNQDKLKLIQQSPTKVTEEVYLINLLGNANLKNVVKKLSKTLMDKEVKKIGFIMDADDNYDAMKDSLEEKINKLKLAGIEADYTYYILPENNSTLGMAEDLLMKGLYKQDLMKVINEEIYPKLISHPEQDIKNEAKTKFMLFGATQSPQSSSASFMLTRSKKLINFEDSVFDTLKNFIFDIIN